MKDDQALGNIRFGTLTRAAEGLTQWRPLLLSFVTLLLSGAVMALGQWLAFKGTSFIWSGIGLLLAVVVLMAGFSGVGIMLMDKAKQQPVRSFTDAATAGLLCLPRFIAVNLLLMLAFFLYMAVAAIIYFVCKIPVLGGLLAFVAHPLLVLTLAAMLVALFWVIGPLMAPALWSGLSIKAALASVIAIARKRLVEVVLLEVLLYIILSLLAVLLFAGLVPASFSLSSLGMSLLGDSNSLMRMFMGMGGGYGGYGGFGNPWGMLDMDGNAWGLIAGLGMMYCVVGALFAQVAVMGLNLIYLQAHGQIDSSDAESSLNDLIDNVRQKANEAKDRAERAVQELKTASASHNAGASDMSSPAPTPANSASAAGAPHPASPAAPVASAHPGAATSAMAAASMAAAASTPATAAPTSAPVVTPPAPPAATPTVATPSAAPVAAPAALPAPDSSASSAMTSVPAPTAHTHCPSCHASVAAEDVFCTECGFRLKNA